MTKTEKYSKKVLYFLYNNQGKRFKDSQIAEKLKISSELFGLAVFKLKKRNFIEQEQFGNPDWKINIQGRTFIVERI